MFPYLSGPNPGPEADGLKVMILGMDRHVWAWIIGGTFAFVACVISVIEMVMHCRFSNDANLRRHTLRILLMVPIYAINAFFGLYMKDSVELWDLAREAYEAVVIYSFYQFLVEYLGGAKRLVYLATSKDPEMDWYRERYRQQQERLAEAGLISTDVPGQALARPVASLNDDGSQGYVPPLLDLSAPGAATATRVATVPAPVSSEPMATADPGSALAAADGVVKVVRRKKSVATTSDPTTSSSTAATAASEATAPVPAAPAEAAAPVSIRGGRRRGASGVEFKKALAPASAELLHTLPASTPAMPMSVSNGSLQQQQQESPVTASGSFRPLPSYSVFSPADYAAGGSGSVRPAATAGHGSGSSSARDGYLAPDASTSPSSFVAGEGALLAPPPPKTEEDEHPKEHYHIMPMNWFFKDPVSPERFVVLTKFGALQYVPIQLFICSLAFILHLCGIEPEWKLNNPHPYFILIINFSQLWAMYGLFWFYAGYSKQLAPCKPLAKALCIKGIVFFTFWQSVVISIWSFFFPVDCVEHPDPHSDLPACTGDQYSTTQRARALQDFIICIEMLAFAIVHMHVFSWKEFEQRRGRDDRTLFRRFVTFFSPHDMVRDVRRNIKPDTLRYVAVDGFASPSRAADLAVVEEEAKTEMEGQEEIDDGVAPLTVNTEDSAI